MSLREDCIERGGNAYEGQCIFCATGIVFSMDSVHEDAEPIKYTHNVSVSVLQVIQEKVINVLSLVKIVTETAK